MDQPTSANPSRQRSPQRPPARRATNEYKLRNQAVIVPDGCLAVGMIADAHGIRGEVRLEVHTDFPERFAPGEILLLGEELAEVEILAARPHKNAFLLKLRGVETRSQADELRGRWLFIDEADAAELDEDTYWVHDIIGLEVETEDGRHLGAISDILVTGANDVYVVRPVPGVNRGKELLLPAIADVVHEVSLDLHRMVVRVPEGLLDAELEV